MCDTDSGVGRALDDLIDDLYESHTWRICAATECAPVIAAWLPRLGGWNPPCLEFVQALRRCVDSYAEQSARAELALLTEYPQEDNAHGTENR